MNKYLYAFQNLVHIMIIIMNATLMALWLNSISNYNLFSYLRSVLMYLK